MPDPSDKLQAALTGRYRLKRELGAGGMATVYLAHDLRHDRPVALKVLRPELAAVIGAERFLAEIKTTANLQHPHILPLFDSGRVDGSVFYVMPYVTGESLRDRLIREKQLPIDDAVRIAREVADALAAAHAAGIIHRDIKPENILLQGDHALVADFGIALAAIRADGTGRMTETGMSLGTPHYMSPEQALGERTLDARTDIYALGCVLYEMLVGEPPFTGPTAQAILAKVMTERPVPIRSTRDTVPHALEAATFKALAKLPADRYASAGAFAEALTRLDEREAGSPARGLTARVIAITAVSTLAAAGITYMAVTREGKPDRGSFGEPRRYSVVLPDSAPLVSLENSGNLPTRSLAVAPDGRSLVYVAETPRGHRLWLVRLDEPGAEELPGTEEAWSPAFSPDSRQIAYVASGGAVVRRLALDTRSPTTVLEVADGHRSSTLIWGRDGHLYFNISPSIGPCLYSVPATGGTARPVATGSCSPDSDVPQSEWIGVSAVDHVGLVSTGGATSTVLRITSGVRPIFLPGDLLAFVREHTVFGASIDRRSLRIAGEPRALFSGIRREQFSTVHWGMSSDGTLVWVAGSNGRMGRLVWGDATGKVVESIPVAPAAVEGLALSDDGSRLAMQTFREDRPARVQVVDLVTHVVDEVVGSEALSPLGWTEDGTSILLSREAGDTAFVARLVAGGWVVDTSAVDYLDSSRDGNWRCGLRNGELAFWRSSAPTESMRLGNAISCLFSPDGRWLLWMAAGGDGTYLIPTNAAGPQARLKVAESQGFFESHWQADSRGFYLRQNNAWYLGRVPARPGQPASTPTLAFTADFMQARNWAFGVGADGRLLLIEGGPSTRTTRLEVMTNFPEYVRRKLAEGNTR